MIFIKTALGQTSLQNRSVALTPRQRAAFIMFDGKRSFDEVLKASSGLGVTQEDVNHLVSLGLLAAQAVPEIEPVVVTAAAALASQGSAELSHTASGLPTASAQARYSKAYPIATRLTASLGLHGFRLNLAVEGANDLDKLKQLGPKIKELVGPERFLELENALYY